MIRHLMASICAMLFLASCSQQSSSVTPQAAGLPLGDLSPGQELPLMAAWDLDISDEGIMLQPVRESALLGDHYTINGGYFFRVSPDSQALRVRGFRYAPTGELAVDWALRHPFKSAAQGATRSDLDVFDVRLAFRPLDQTPRSFSGASRTAYSDLLLEADGYTPDLAPMLQDPAVVPYIIHRNESDFNRLAQGTDYQQLTSVFRFGPGEQAQIRVYLLCQYGASATRQTRLTPTYYNPEYNLKSPWMLTATPEPGVIISGQPGSLEVTVTAADWNDSRTGVSVDSGYPNPSNTSGLRSGSDLTSVTLFAPDLSPTPVTVTSPTGGTGAPGSPLTFSLITNTASAPAPGTYQALIQAVDSRLPNDNANPSENGINVMSNGALDFVALNEYSTWQVVEYVVEAGVSNDPPVAIISTIPNPPTVQVNQLISFLGNNSTDDGGIVQYEWDFDYQAGSPAFVDLGPTPSPQTYPVAGTYTVALRVTDNGTPALQDITTVDVTVNPLPPVGNCGLKAVWGGSSSPGYRGNPDGTGSGTVSGSGRYFRISGNGEVVVYSAGAGIGGSLYVWRQSTGSQLLRPQSDDPLTYGFRADEVDLTNDGSVVVYTDARAGANPAKDSWIQSTTGGTALKISPGDGGTYEWPRISQQGNKVIVYKRSASQLYSVNPDGSSWSLVSPASGGPASINSDGTKVYVERTFRNLWRVDIDGNNPVFLRYVGDYFVVSANEQTMVYMDVYDNGRDVWVANVDGSGTPIKVLDADVDGFSGYWVSVSCDGEWVGFGSGFGGGGTWRKSTGQRYLSTASAFPASLYDGVTVGTVGTF